MKHTLKIICSLYLSVFLCGACAVQAADLNTSPLVFPAAHAVALEYAMKERKISILTCAAVRRQSA